MSIYTTCVVAQRICLAFIHGGDTAGAFTESVATTLIKDQGRHISHVFGFQSSPRIATARCMVVAHFLEELRDCDWLWFLDSDMAWDYEAARLLFETADRKNVPILGGLCFAGGRSYTESGKPTMFPTIYRLIADEDGSPSIDRVTDFPRNELIEVGATGAACLLIHRSVLVEMFKRYRYMPDGHENPFPWFAETVLKGKQYGEDTSFCLRAQACGFKVHVHTGVDIKHRKSMFLDTAMWDELHRPKRKQAPPDPHPTWLRDTVQQVNVQLNRPLMLPPSLAS